MSCFQVYFEWSKCLGRIGENEIENRFLHAKTQKRVSACLHRRHDCAPPWDRSCVPLWLGWHDRSTFKHDRASSTVPENLVFVCFYVFLSMPMIPKQLNLII